MEPAVERKSGKNGKGLEFSGQQALRIAEAEPAIDYAGIDAAKIRREDQIVSFVQLGQAGRAPVVTAIDRLADDIHVVRRSMIGAETGIFRHAASELRKYE